MLSDRGQLQSHQHGPLGSLPGPHRSLSFRGTSPHSIAVVVGSHTAPPQTQSPGPPCLVQGWVSGSPSGMPPPLPGPWPRSPGGARAEGAAGAGEQLGRGGGAGRRVSPRAQLPGSPEPAAAPPAFPVTSLPPAGACWGLAGGGHAVQTRPAPVRFSCGLFGSLSSLVSSKGLFGGMAGAVRLPRRGSPFPNGLKDTVCVRTDARPRLSPSCRDFLARSLLVSRGQ